MRLRIRRPKRTISSEDESHDEAGIKRIRLGDKGKGRETEEPIIPWAKRTEVKKTDPDTRLFHDHKGIKWLMKQYATGWSRHFPQLSDMPPNWPGPMAWDGVRDEHLASDRWGTWRYRGDEEDGIEHGKAPSDVKVSVPADNGTEEGEIVDEEMEDGGGINNFASEEFNWTDTRYETPVPPEAARMDVDDGDVEVRPRRKVKAVEQPTRPRLVDGGNVGMVGSQDTIYIKSRKKVEALGQPTRSLSSIEEEGVSQHHRSSKRTPTEARSKGDVGDVVSSEGTVYIKPRRKVKPLEQPTQPRLLDVDEGGGGNVGTDGSQDTVYVKSRKKAKAPGQPTRSLSSIEEEGVSQHPRSSTEARPKGDVGDAVSSEGTVYIKPRRKVKAPEQPTRPRLLDVDEGDGGNVGTDSSQDTVYVNSRKKAKALGQPTRSRLSSIEEEESQHPRSSKGLVTGYLVTPTKARSQSRRTGTPTAPTRASSQIHRAGTSIPTPQGSQSRQAGNDTLAPPTSPTCTLDQPEKSSLGDDWREGFFLDIIKLLKYFDAKERKVDLPGFEEGIGKLILRKTYPKASWLLGWINNNDFKKVKQLRKALKLVESHLGEAADRLKYVDRLRSTMDEIKAEDVERFAMACQDYYRSTNRIE